MKAPPAASPPSPPTGQREAWRTRLGGGLLALGSAQFFVMHLVVQSAWTQPPYSWWSNYVSDLGAVACAPVLSNPVCSPLHLGMNMSFVAQGLLLLAGTVLTANAWANPSHPRRWQTLVGLAALSWIVIGLVPEDVDLTVHSIGALPIFVLGNLALLVAGTSASTRNRPAIRRAALVLGVVGLLGFALTLVAIATAGGGLGVGTAERVTVFPLQVWGFVCGLGISTTANRPNLGSCPDTTEPARRTPSDGSS